MSRSPELHVARIWDRNERAKEIQAYASPHNNKKEASNKDHSNPQPRDVQDGERRQSGKCPVGDGADLVAVQLPAPDNHRVSKRSHLHRSKAHRHPDRRYTPLHMSPLPIRLPLSSPSVVPGWFARVTCFRMHSPCQMHTGQVGKDSPEPRQTQFTVGL